LAGCKETNAGEITMSWEDILKMSDDLLEILNTYIEDADLSFMEQFEMTDNMYNQTRDPEVKIILEKIKNSIRLTMNGVNELEKYQKVLDAKNKSMQVELQ
jgi:hypothetical protein